jgi:hypothetical protein
VHAPGNETPARPADERVVVPPAGSAIGDPPLIAGSMSVALVDALTGVSRHGSRATFTPAVTARLTPSRARSGPSPALLLPVTAAKAASVARAESSSRTRGPDRCAGVAGVARRRLRRLRASASRAPAARAPAVVDSQCRCHCQSTSSRRIPRAHRRRRSILTSGPRGHAHSCLGCRLSVTMSAQGDDLQG